MILVTKQTLLTHSFSQDVRIPAPFKFKSSISLESLEVLLVSFSSYVSSPRPRHDSTDVQVKGMVFTSPRSHKPSK